MQRLILAWFLFSSVALHVNAGYLAGVLKVDITPLDPSTAPRLAGHRLGGREYPESMRHTRIYVRTLVLQSGDTKVAFISVDLIGMFKHSLEQVHDAFPGVNCLVSFTHNHSAPDTVGGWDRRGIKEYKEFVRSAVIRSVSEAMQNMVSVELAVGSAQVTGLSQDFRKPVLLDNNMCVLFVKNEKTGELISTLVNWASHPTLLNGRSQNLSGDYPAVLTHLIDERLGGVSLFVNGAIGGQVTSTDAHFSGQKEEMLLNFSDPETEEEAPRSSRDAIYNDIEGMKRAEILAKNLYYSVHDIYAMSEPVTSDTLVFRKSEFEVPVQGINFLASSFFLDNEEVELFIGSRPGVRMGVFLLVVLLFVSPCLFVYVAWNYRKYENWFHYLAQLTFLFMLLGISLNHALLNGYYTVTEVNYVNVGGMVEIVTFPGEPYPESVLGISEIPDPDCDFKVPWSEPVASFLHAKHRMVFSVTNDMKGYIVPECLWDDERPYAYDCIDVPQYDEENSLGPKTETIIIHEMKELVKGGS